MLDLDDIKALLDLATNSMDWSSGFLDDEEVGVLRRVAVAVGADPIEATPHEWRMQYAHTFRRSTRQRWWPKIAKVPAHVSKTGSCEHCPLNEADPIHHGIDNRPSPEEGR